MFSKVWFSKVGLTASRLPQVWTVLIATCFLVGFGTDSTQLQADQPNIVLIYADDHSQAAVSCYGSRINRTPNIDRLAKQGIRFSNSFVGNSICGPARATVLTGLHSHANGKLDNRGGFNQSLPTFAKVLGKQGYATAIFGKWHIRTDPVGFDRWETLGGGYYNPVFKTKNGNVKTTGYVSDIITDRSIEWMKEQKAAKKPFVVWVSHSATHRTWMPATRHLTKYDNKTIEEPKTLFDDYAGKSPGAKSAQMRISRDMFPAYDLKLPVTGNGFLDRAMESKLKRMTDAQRDAWHKAYSPKNKKFEEAKLEGKERTRWKYQRYIKDYLRCVDGIDENVGKIMDFLKEEDLEKNTIVIYTSDQGFFLGEHGWYDKRWMYEPSFRTPLIVRWPGKIKSGLTCDQLVQNIDLAPTLIDCVGAKVPENMHGKSMVPLFKKPDANWRDELYYHYHMVEPDGKASHLVARHYGIRTARHKLIHVYDHKTWELYDLQSDPDETKNLIDSAEHQALVVQLKRP